VEQDFCADPISESEALIEKIMKKNFKKKINHRRVFPEDSKVEFPLPIRLKSSNLMVQIGTFTDFS
jgi:hypothetical protein